MAPGKDGKEGITLLQLFAVYPHNETTVVGEYVHGKAHISGMESFWSMMKRRYHGVYHKVYTKLLSHYTDEFSGLHKVRDGNTIEQMGLVVLGLEGKRFTYSKFTEPTGRHTGERY